MTDLQFPYCVVVRDGDGNVIEQHPVRDLLRARELAKSILAAHPHLRTSVYTWRERPPAWSPS